MMGFREIAKNIVDFFKENLDFECVQGRGVQCSDLGCSKAPPKGVGPANFNELFIVLKPRDLVNT